MHRLEKSLRDSAARAALPSIYVSVCTGMSIVMDVFQVDTQSLSSPFPGVKTAVRLFYPSGASIKFAFSVYNTISF
jgi:hypothetical protein